MTDDPEKNPSAGEDVFEDEHVFILDDGGVVTPVTWNHRVLMTEEDGNSANDGTTNANNLEPPRALDRRASREILLHS